MLGGAFIAEWNLSQTRLERWLGHISKSGFLHPSRSRLPLTCTGGLVPMRSGSDLIKATLQLQISIDGYLRSVVAMSWPAVIGSVLNCKTMVRRL